MAFGPVARRRGSSSPVATTIAHVLSQGGSRVGAVLFDTGVRTVIPPASGRNQVLRIARRCSTIAKWPGPEASPTSAPSSARRQGWPAPVLVIVVSDFISAEGGSVRWPCSPAAMRSWRYR